MADTKVIELAKRLVEVVECRFAYGLSYDDQAVILSAARELRRLQALADGRVE